MRERRFRALRDERGLVIPIFDPEARGACGASEERGWAGWSGGSGKGRGGHRGAGGGWGAEKRRRKGRRGAIFEISFFKTIFAGIVDTTRKSFALSFG
jgi:hypothetical protein